MHCLVKCKIVALVWFVSPLTLRTLVETSSSFANWFKYWYNLSCFSKHDRNNSLSIVVIFEWNIWKSCNKAVFEKLSFNMSNVTSVAFRMLYNSYAKLYLFCYWMSRTTISLGSPRSWSFWRLTLMVLLVWWTFCGIGVVIRDWRGNFVLAKSEWCLADSALVIKCLAACLVLSTAHDLGLSHIILDGDSLEVISLLSDMDCICPLYVNNIIYDCQYFIGLFPFFKCIQVKWCANFVVDHLAKHGTLVTSSQVCPLIPPWIRGDLDLDVPALMQSLYD